jgi:hypothetical protein
MARLAEISTSDFGPSMAPSCSTIDCSVASDRRVSLRMTWLSVIASLTMSGRHCSFVIGSTHSRARMFAITGGSGSSGRSGGGI